MLAVHTHKAQETRLAFTKLHINRTIVGHFFQHDTDIINLPRGNPAVCKNELRCGGFCRDINDQGI